MVEILLRSNVNTVLTDMCVAILVYPENQLSHNGCKKHSLATHDLICGYVTDIVTETMEYKQTVMTLCSYKTNKKHDFEYIITLCVSKDNIYLMPGVIMTGLWIVYMLTHTVRADNIG